jgi:LysR family hydrogen peroxide-inducible transcriptional activator
MNIRDLRYLVAIEDLRHFGRAADKCHVSQPTLSGQIRKLEEELGVTLFERTSRSVEITPIGERIVALARKLLEQGEAIEQLARSYRDPVAGPLRIGAIHTLSPFLVPLIVMPLRQKYPNMELILREGTTEQLLSLLRDHALDAILIATDELREDFGEIPLFDEPFWLAHPANHPLYIKDDITLEDLSQLDLLLLSEEHCLSGQVMSACSMQRRPESGPVADFSAASLETLVQLVGMGVGSTLVPALAVHGGRLQVPGVIVRKLNFVEAGRRVRMIYRATFPRMQALEAMAAVIRTHLPNTVHVLPSAAPPITTAS